MTSFPFVPARDARFLTAVVATTIAAVTLVGNGPASGNPLAQYAFTTDGDQSSSDTNSNSLATDVASPIEWTLAADGRPAKSIFMGGKFKAVGPIGPTTSTTDFLVFTVTPVAGQQMDLQSLHFDLNRTDSTSTGSYALYVDEAPAANGNNFKTKIGGGSIVSTGIWDTAQIDLSSYGFLQNVRTPTTFRLYLYGETASGVSEFDNLVLDGSTEVASPGPIATTSRVGYVGQYAVARPVVPGAPKYDDVVFSSRWMHPRNATDTDDTYAAIAQFQPTSMVWANPHTASGKGNANYVKSIVSSGVDFGGTVSGTSTDSPFLATYVVGRDRLLDGTSTQEGDVTSQDFRNVILSHMKFMVDNGAATFQIDDPTLTYGEAQSAGGGYGTSAMTKFTSYLSSHDFAGQYGLPSNLTGFDYRVWVNGRPNQTDTTPVRTAFLNFHLDQLQEFYTYEKTQIDNYAGHYVPFSVNNSSTNVQTGAPYTYPEIDFWLGETSEQFGGLITNGPKGVYQKVKGAEAVGRRQVFSPPNDQASYGTITSDAQYLQVSRQLFGAAYASGSVALVPWDVYRRDDPRYFATFAQFGDLTHLVGQNQKLFDKHEQVFAVGSGLSPQFAAGLTVEPIKLVGTSSKFLATVRAAPNGTDAVVHLVDWNTTTSGFLIDLQNTLFGWPTDMPVTARLLLPSVTGTIEQILTGTLNVVAGYTRFSIPALNPYALLAVQAMSTIPGDFNNDGKVDSADYAVWRKKFGSSDVLPNDPTPGVVSQSDFALWRANFGKSVSGGFAAGASVPEPSAVTLVIAAFAACGRRRRIPR